MAFSPIKVRTADLVSQDQDIAADDATGLMGKAPILKLAYGDEGEGILVSETNPLPLRIMGGNIMRSDLANRKWWVVETKPTVDNDDPDAVHDGDVVVVLETV